MKNTVWVITNNSLFYFLPFFFCFIEQIIGLIHPSLTYSHRKRKKKSISGWTKNIILLKFKCKLKYYKFIDKINFTTINIFFKFFFNFFFFFPKKYVLIYFLQKCLDIIDEYVIICKIAKINMWQNFIPNLSCLIPWNNKVSILILLGFCTYRICMHTSYLSIFFTFLIRV